MFKGKGQDGNGNDLWVFGLSDGNIRELKRGRPIKIDLAQCGGRGTVIILYGRTDQLILEELTEAGMIRVAH
jgi:hypothetical protein